MDEFAEKTKAFEAFLDAKGVQVSPKVTIADFREAGQGRGLRAVDEISEGEVLFTIPPQALLQAEADAQLLELVEKHELDGWTALILRMLAVQASREWKPYFDVLPTKFNTPMFWDTQETERLLQGSEVIEKIGRAEADEMYDELAAGVLKDKYFANVPDTSREAFHRMGSLIMSYAFDVPDDTSIDNTDNNTGNNTDNNADNNTDEDSEVGSESRAMVPLADILNSHTKLQNARLTMPEAGNPNFEMVASKRIAKGDQIYNIYGNQPSSDMLRRYGFVEAGGTFYEAVELGLKLVAEQASAVLGLSTQTVEQRVKALEKRIDEVPASFEIGLTVEDDDTAVPEIEFEPELLLTVNALTQPELSRKTFKAVAGLLSSEHKLFPDAARLLTAVIEARKQDYGAPPTPPQAGSAQVLLDKADMCAQVRLAELQVLDMALDWLAEDVPNKRAKLA